MGLPGKCHNHQLFILVTPCEILQWVPELLSHSPWDWAFDFLLPAESGFQGQPLKQMLLTDVGLIGSIFGGGLRQMLRHRENFIFHNTVSPLGMAQLSSWGSEVYPPFFGLILNFLTDINKLKEIRVDEGIGSGNGELGGSERYLGMKMDFIVLDVAESELSGLVPRFALSQKMGGGTIL